MMHLMLSCIYARTDVPYTRADIRLQSRALPSSSRRLCSMLLMISMLPPEAHTQRRHKGRVRDQQAAAAVAGLHSKQQQIYEKLVKLLSMWTRFPHT